MRDDQRYSVEGAREAAERDELAGWVRAFLASPGSDNPVLANELGERHRWWAGPLLVPLHELQRLAGPPTQPVLCPVDEGYWDGRVDDMARRIAEEGWTPPPLIVSYRDGGFVLEDGNHRAESLRRAGRTHAWAVIGFSNEADLAAFEVPASP